MAQKIIRVDDLDGTEGADIQTVDFSWAGQAYEIDLSDSNRAEFEKAIEKFIKAGRKVTGRSSSGSKSPAYDAGAVRSWARENGIEVSDRGRINKTVLDQYFAKH